MSIEHPDPCGFFAEQSKYVWNRIAFSREMNIRISETSITEELIYQFYRAFWETTIPVRIFESVEEHKNGSDLEILVKTNRGFILLACQAKITYKTGNYQSFWHEVRGVPQIDLLRDYAKRKGGIAQYLLYNYIPEWKMSPECLALEEIENYGLTHVSADEIYSRRVTDERSGKKIKIPTFNMLHPELAIPLHMLICALLEDSEPFDDFFPKTSLAELTYYSESAIMDSDDWREMTRLGQIGFVEQEYSEQRADTSGETTKAMSQNLKPAFNPKFRIAIGGTRQVGAIYRIE
jgi:hypothetical protein